MKALVTAILLALCLSVFAFSRPVTNASYTFTIIDNPAADALNGERSMATGINSAGRPWIISGGILNRFST